MPPRESVAEYHNHRILARVIEQVLRCRSGRILVPALAETAGFSRFHLARLFHRTAQETLEEFLRRIRLERAAYVLLHSELRVFQVARDCGYRSPEAFSRAFRRAYGCLPTEARGRLETWELPSVADLHWNADWALDLKPGNYQEAVVHMPTRYACVSRAVGDYAELAAAWRRLETARAGQIPNGTTFVTIYLDNLWTHPVCRTLKAELGWLCSAEFEVPAGMRKTLLPQGQYATTRFIDREERTEAWSYMTGRYLAGRSGHPRPVAYDEYAFLPLPFEAAKTRILVATG
jgi:AraC family transcriptional regulator